MSLPYSQQGHPIIQQQLESSVFFLDTILLLSSSNDLLSLITSVTASPKSNALLQSRVFFIPSFSTRSISTPCRIHQPTFPTILGDNPNTVNERNLQGFVPIRHFKMMTDEQLQDKCANLAKAIDKQEPAKTLLPLLKELDGKGVPAPTENVLRVSLLQKLIAFAK